MKIKQNLSLLTINGSCGNGKLKLMKYKNIDLYPHYKLRRVRNFVTFNLKTMGLCVNLYSKGCFKVTVKASNYSNYVLTNINYVLNSLVDIMELFYQTDIKDVTARITQLACMVQHKFKTPTNFNKLSYEQLISCRDEKKNKVVFYCENYKFEHEINWEGLENGMSNYYFKVSQRDCEVNLFGVKLYNNLKLLIFYYKSFEVNFAPIAILMVDQLLQRVESSVADG